MYGSSWPLNEAEIMHSAVAPAKRPASLIAPGHVSDVTFVHQILRSWVALNMQTETTAFSVDASLLHDHSEKGMKFLQLFFQLLRREQR
jgi:hypothetical protein